MSSSEARSRQHVCALARNATTETPQHVSDYREFLPPAALREHVLCFWTQSMPLSEMTYAHRVLPDACVDLVVFQGQPPAVIGPWTEAFIVLLAPGTRITGVRFHPGKAAAMLGLPASELINQQAALGDIWRAAAREPFAKIGELDTFRGGRLALEGALTRRIRTISQPDAVVAGAIRWLAQHPGARIEELSHLAGISNRQMQRRFSAAVGYGPKMFQSVLRFQRLLYLASVSDGQCGLADLSARAGYADQSHMTREVRRFAEKSPGDLLTSAGCTLRLTDLLEPSKSGEFRGSGA